jgi:phosphotransacetylase
MRFEQLIRRADDHPRGAPVVCAGGADATVIEALAIARRRGWLQPVLAGKRDDIVTVARQCGADPGQFRVLDTEDPAAAAVAECRSGRAAVLIKGNIATPELLRPVLCPETGLRTGRTICQVVLMEVPVPRQPFLLADTGITIDPTLEQKADIIRSVIDTARRLGVPRPRIALLAATEKATPAMPDTLEAAELARQAAAGAFPDSDVAGPLSFDLACAPEAGRRKRITGAVVGAADGLVFPNLVAANLTVKAIMCTASCRFGGVLCGTACPIAFMSRADDTGTRLNSLALALRLLEMEDAAVAGSQVGLRH